MRGGPESGGSDEVGAAIGDRATRRQLRRRKIRVIVALASGIVLIASLPVLGVVATNRERQFAAHADLVSARVLDQDANSVQVEFVRRGRRFYDDLRVVSSRYHPGASVAVLVDRRDVGVAYLQGEVTAFLPTPLSIVFLWGWALGIGLVAVGVFLGWRTRRVSRLLSSHPWRELDLHWDRSTDRLVGMVEGAWVAYGAPAPGNATVAVAGAMPPRDGERSVMRMPPATRLHVVKSHPMSPPSPPRPVEELLPPPPPPRPVETLFGGHESLELEGGKRLSRGKSCQVRSADGTLLASITRAPFVIEAFDPSSVRLFELRGVGHGVVVLDRNGDRRGTIDFRRRGGALYLPGERQPVAQVHRVDRDHTVIRAEAGEVELSRITRESTRRATVRLTDSVSPQLWLLLLAASLTMYWRPVAPSGGA